MRVDVLAIGPHPDDIELCICGTLLKLIDRGKTVVIADLTRGEMGTHGAEQIRLREASEAASRMGVCERVNLNLGDGIISDNLNNRIKIVELIREFRPSIVMTNYWDDLHPDHSIAGQLVAKCSFLAGLLKYPASKKHYRPREVLHYMSHYSFVPTFIVDTTQYFEKKLDVLGAYSSQFKSFEAYNFGESARQDFKKFFHAIEIKDRYYGSCIRCSFGEPFFVKKALPMNDPVDHFLDPDLQRR
ncbi:MAG: bacillithiol biosynthesis deacetylase BshB1 [bacterium]